MEDLREMLKISTSRLDMINQFLSDPENEAVNAIMELVDNYGGPDEINRKAAEAQKPETLLNQLKEMNSPYVNDFQTLNDFVFSVFASYREGIDQSFFDTITAITCNRHTRPVIVVGTIQPGLKVVDSRVRGRRST